MNGPRGDRSPADGAAAEAQAGVFEGESFDSPERDTAEWLNAHCYCVALDDAALAEELATAGPAGERMFARYPVFVAPGELAAMRRCIEAVEAATALPAYRERVLGEAAAIARHDPGARGVFFGYDFHLSEQGPKLIEINTNAGGALLALATSRAQRGDCEPCSDLVRPAAPLAGLEMRIAETFRAEWCAAGRSGRLSRIAIVDEAPSEQYLYPEFVLFTELLERAGIETVIAAPDALGFDGERLSAGGKPVDLVYNRSTDFYLETDRSQVLREAYLADRVVVTPHPRAHALYARKSNLVLLSDAVFLREAGLAEEHRQALLAHIPETRRLDVNSADALWTARRSYYFKPVLGFGSRATYAGRKLTRKTWAAIVAGDYVAQRTVTPSRRTGLQTNGVASLKLDIRHYTYAGQTQLVAARLYRGQTTNFRTEGGGFAPVLIVPPSSSSEAILATQGESD